MSTYEVVLERIRNQPRTWLVTGAAGFIGSHLLEALLKLDQTVVGLDNFATGKRENLVQVMQGAGLKRRKNLRFIEGDIRSYDTCRAACRGVDVVLHEAAIGSVPRSIEDPRETNSANIDGFVNMLTAARDAKVARFVYAASSSTYGDGKRIPMVEAEIGQPLSPYALTKYVDELYANVFARCYGTQAIGLRYFNVFGPRQDPDGAYAAVIPKWIAALLHNEPVYINGDGTTARDFCYVENVVQANLLAAMVTDAAAINEVYNVARGAQTTLDELFLMIRMLLAPSYPAAMTKQPVYRDFRPGDMHISQADIGKAQALLGYQPAWDVREGMKWAVDWYVSTLAASLPVVGDTLAQAAGGAGMRVAKAAALAS
ncbi:MAG: Vi polysaccharide biosynthesis protein VipB/TviC [Rhodocyclales bacterium GWA2_65_20]|nr:MAG: Vi polysaccharide biosynthesis protein VipB/TviC [Rhodocyclales bacterium GWA2_65_20]